MQIFRPRANIVARSVLIGGAALPFALIGLTYAVMESPYTTGQAITLNQPVPFSHKHHVRELGLDCRYCHSGVEKSPVAGVPPTETCMTCHSQIWTNAAMLAPVRKSLAEKTPIRWNRVHRLPQYAYFDHSIHIAKGIGCSSCHGRIDEMPLTQQAAPLTMDWCLDCHRDPAPNLRPKKEIFNSEWTAAGVTPEQRAALVRYYDIHASTLTECSTCHR